MARRIEAYEVKRGDNLGDPQFWNKILEDLDLRLANAEDGLRQLDAVGDRVESAALDRMNTVITPIVVEAQRRMTSVPDLFTATSVSSRTIGFGETTFVVEIGQRATFVVGAYLRASRVADPNVWMAGTVISYVPETGELVLDIDEISRAGTFADWRFRTAGRRGPIGPIGHDGLLFKGDYNPGTAYVPRDVVHYQGSSFRNRLASTGIAPPTYPGESNANWQLVVKRGTDGAHGKDGRDGVDGQDGDVSQATLDAAVSGLQTQINGHTTQLSSHQTQINGKAAASHTHTHADLVNVSQNLTDAPGGTVNWPVGTSPMARLVMGGASTTRTLAVPTGLTPGTYILVVEQAGDGNNNIAWSGGYRFPGNVAPVLATGVGKKTVIPFVFDGDEMLGSFTPYL